MSSCRIHRIKHTSINKNNNNLQREIEKSQSIITCCRLLSRSTPRRMSSAATCTSHFDIFSYWWLCSNRSCVWKYDWEGDSPEPFIQRVLQSRSDETFSQSRLFRSSTYIQVWVWLIVFCCQTTSKDILCILGRVPKVTEATPTHSNRLKSMKKWIDSLLCRFCFQEPESFCFNLIVCLTFAWLETREAKVTIGYFLLIVIGRFPKQISSPSWMSKSTGD